MKTSIPIPILIKIVKIPNNIVLCVVKMKLVSSMPQIVTLASNNAKPEENKEIGFGSPQQMPLNCDYIDISL